MAQAPVPTRPEDIVKLVDQYSSAEFVAERTRLDRLDLWLRWEHEPIVLPPSATHEHRVLADISRTPLLGLVVSTISQGLFIDGFRSPQSADGAGAWPDWQRNSMDAKQDLVIRAAVGYGIAYTVVTDGHDAWGRPAPVIRAVSPKSMIAFYDDQANDAWPQLAIEKTRDGYLVYTATRIYSVQRSEGTGRLSIASSSTHPLGVVPVVRWVYRLDIDGRITSAIDPLIVVASRIDKTAYDRLLAQHFNSWKIRTISGLAGFADSSEEARVKKLLLRQEDLLVAEDPDTKFGTLDATPLDGFIEAYKSDVGTLATLAQVPVTSLESRISNISADAITELRAGMNAQLANLQTSFGNSATQTLQLCSRIRGDVVAADDWEAEVSWQNRTPRTLASTMDALGKAATMLGVPGEELWQAIPGFTKSDVDAWKASRGSSPRDAGQLPAETAGGNRNDAEERFFGVQN